MMGLATGRRKKFCDIFSCLYAIYDRDRQTDGRTPGDSKARAYALCRAVPYSQCSKCTDRTMESVYAII